MRTRESERDRLPESIAAKLKKKRHTAREGWGRERERERERERLNERAFFFLTSEARSFSIGSSYSCIQRLENGFSRTEIAVSAKISDSIYFMAKFIRSNWSIEWSIVLFSITITQQAQWIIIHFAMLQVVQKSILMPLLKLSFLYWPYCWSKSLFYWH